MKAHKLPRERRQIVIAIAGRPAVLRGWLATFPIEYCMASRSAWILFTSWAQRGSCLPRTAA